MKNMLNRLKEKQNKKGFTLVEIIVVLVILAILAAIAIPAVLGYVEDARQAQYIAEARSIYLVVQTEEAKIQAKDGVGEYSNSNHGAYDILYARLIDKGIVSNKGEGIISEKTGLPKVTGVFRMYDEHTDMYHITWTSSNGKEITAFIEKTSKLNLKLLTEKRLVNYFLFKHPTNLDVFLCNFVEL